MAKRFASNTMSFETSLRVAKEFLRYRILESTCPVLDTDIHFEFSHQDQPGTRLLSLQDVHTFNLG